MARPTGDKHFARNPGTGEGQPELRYVMREKKSGTLDRFLLGVLATCIGVSLLLYFF